MSDIFINFGVTVNKLENDSVFISNNGDAIISCFKQQENEEKIKSYSYKQYKSLIYQTAYNYCLFLFTLSLTALTNETMADSEKRCKRLYRFDDIQTNLAHIGIDLDSIYEAIVLNYIPVEYEQQI